MALLEKNIDSFARSYMAAAVWSSVNDEDIEDGDDLAGETETTMLAECRAFLESHGHLIASEPDPKLSGDGSDRWSHAGHDFWLTRCGHGCGFWDGDWPVNGDALTALCGFDTDHPPLDLYKGDDGLLYQS